MSIQLSPPIFSDVQPDENAFRLESGQTPSEPSIHQEHLAALDATLFRSGGSGLDELTFELESGQLRRFLTLN